MDLTVTPRCAQHAGNASVKAARGSPAAEAIRERRVWLVLPRALEEAVRVVLLAELKALLDWAAQVAA